MDKITNADFLMDEYKSLREEYLGIQRSLDSSILNLVSPAIAIFVAIFSDKIDHPFKILAFPILLFIIGFKDYRMECRQLDIADYVQNVLAKEIIEGYNYPDYDIGFINFDYVNMEKGKPQLRNLPYGSHYFTSLPFMISYLIVMFYIFKYIAENFGTIVINYPIILVMVGCISLTYLWLLDSQIKHSRRVLKHTKHKLRKYLKLEDSDKEEKEFIL